MRYFVTSERTLLSGGLLEAVATETAVCTDSETVSDGDVGIWWNHPEIFQIIDVGQ